MNKKEIAMKKKRQTARSRWKNVERSTATELTALYSDIGKSPVFRIPILGREGPDITVNEVGLVINVKSRKVIPDRLFPKAGEILYFGTNDMVCFRLNELLTIANYSSTPPARPEEGWKQLYEWWEFMDKWTKEFKPEGISAVFLHHPRMPIGNIGIAIHFNDLRRLSCKIHNVQSN